MNTTDLVVGYDKTQTQARRKRARTALIYRSLSTLISLGICVVIMVTVGRDWTTRQILFMFGIWGGVSLLWLVVSVVGLVRASRDLRAIGEGAAVVMSEAGIRVKDLVLPWSGVKHVWAKGALSSAGPKLVVIGQHGEWVEVPFSFLDAMPGTIDSALRAYGRPPLDTQPLTQFV